MNRGRSGWFGVLFLLASAGLGCGAASTCAAAPVVIHPSLTTMTSSADRMISYRHQNHMWQTSDGATHVMINRGTQSQGNALQLFSTFDGGATWSGGLTLPNSNSQTTSDGYIVADALYVTYSTSSGAIVFCVMQYDASSHSWSNVESQTAFSSSSLVAINPAIAADSLGTIWLGFVANETSTGNYFIKLLQRTSDAQGWVDTGMVFGAVDNLSIERSARPVMTANGMGMVYTVHQNIYWAFRNNNWPLAQAWRSQLMFTSQSDDTDPYASHFSVVADARMNIHMVTVDGGRILYFRLADTTPNQAVNSHWTARWLTKDISSGYPQVTLVAGNIFIVSNMSTQACVYQSSDGGFTFTATQQLVHPAPAGGVSYSYPRIETPAVSRSPVPLLQQYDDNNTQRVMYFRVPAVQVGMVGSDLAPLAADLTCADPL